MIELTKIRLKYYKNLKYYILFSLFIVFILLLFFSTFSAKKYMYNYPKKVYDNDNYSTDILKSIISNELFTDTLSKTSLIVKDINLGEELKEYIINQYYISISINNEESQNKIILDYDKNSNKYKFSFSINDKDDSPNNYAFSNDFLSNYEAKEILTHINRIDFESDYFKNNIIFLIYHSLLSKFIIKHETGALPNKSLKIFEGFNSYPPSTEIDENDINQLINILGLEFYYISLFFSIHILEEKEKKVDLLLNGLGITRMQNFMSWIFVYLIQNSVLIISIYICFNLILCFSHFLVVLYLIAYLTTTFLITYLISSFSGNKGFGLIIYNIITVFPFIISYAMQGNEMNEILEFILCLAPILNVSVTFEIMSKYNYVKDFPLGIITLKINGTSYLINLLILIIESFIIILIIFLKKKSSQYGLKLFYFIKFYFKYLFSKNKSFYNIIEEEYKKNRLIIDDYENESIYIKHEELSDINKSLKKENEYLKIENISKNYFGSIKAVKNASVDLFKNEIFVILGHNGAGKTSLIKTISGAETPNSGNIFLNNKSLINDRDYLYKNVSICYHENLFFDYLTVEEQLKFIMKIKKDIYNQEQINNLIKSIGLSEKKNSQCKNLSGGEKKKLCIAMALIANSKIVILDEPSSELDIVSRRNLWNFLKDYKKDKIIIITTHSLEEAEFLGDRIGIMNNGIFICSGSSSFLKKTYETGVNLNLMVNNNIFTNNKKNELISVLRNYDPNLEIKFSSNEQFSFILDSNNININSILEIIEKNKDLYGIEYYTVTSTSLEDVFLKVNYISYYYNNLNKKKKSLIGGITNNTNNNIGNNNIINDDEDINNIDIKNENKNKKNNKNNNKDNMINENTDNNIIIDDPINSINSNNNNINNIIQIKNPEINKSVSFCSQLFSHLLRLFSGFWRLILFHLLNYFYCILFLFMYLIIHTAKFNDKPITENTFDLIELLDSNTIFTNDIDYLKASSIYKNSFDFKKINEQNNLRNFSEEIYKSAYLNIGKSGIQIKRVNENETWIYITELPVNRSSYIMANLMFSVSAFFKNEYNLNVEIFPKIKYSKETRIDINKINGMLILGYISTLSYTFFLMSILGEKTHERINGLKQLIYLSGADMKSYWLSHFIYDYIRLFILNLLIVLGIFIVSEGSIYIFVIFSLASFSALFFIYILSKYFGKIGSSQLLLFFIYLIFTIIPNIFNNIFKYYENLINPNYTFYDIIPLISMMKACYSMTLSYFPEIVPADQRIFKAILIQLINFIIYLILFILNEKNIIEKFFNYIKVKYIIKDNNFTFSTQQIDQQFLNDNNLSAQDIPLLPNININGSQNNDDINLNLIENERNKVIDDLSTNLLPTKIVGLRKTYWFCCKKNIRAVNNINFGLENKEKFGLLGFNGGGKTTTFKSIAKEILIDSGLIFLNNKNINIGFDEIRKLIGYCPQENPIIEYMTVRELLLYFMDLKEIPEIVENVAAKFGLAEYINTYCGFLSAGNKRKLSFALALLNNPEILLLDEPSNGVDPQSRRIMWKNIKDLNKKNKKFNMILTTHSMEEAEILCDRISWIKKGKFMTIGNPEKLKLLLNVGYNLHIKFVNLSYENNNVNNENSDLAIKDLGLMIKNFNNYIPLIDQNPFIKPYLNELLILVISLKENCEEIYIKSINNDISFDFNLKVNKEKYKQLFSLIFNMKTKNNLLSQLDLSTESLESLLVKI